MLLWIKRILMLVGLYVVLNYFGLWDSILNFLLDIPTIVAAVVGLG